MIYSSSSGISSKFCKICGAPFLTMCKDCGYPLPSSFQTPVYLTSGDPVNVPYKPGACSNCGKVFPWTLNEASYGPKSNTEALSILSNMCNRFHAVAKQLRKRHVNRETLDIGDEYDVQDLIHAILQINFGDIRKEEWTPSYAGGSSRMDFLLIPYGIVLEVKKTRKGFGSKELGKQLIDDIVRYEKHPGCKMLVCFIYDPEERVTNPKGLIMDLDNLGRGLKIKVFISPMN
jgi:hypothetical protein